MLKPRLDSITLKILQEHGYTEPVWIDHNLYAFLGNSPIPVPVDPATLEKVETERKRQERLKAPTQWTQLLSVTSNGTKVLILATLLTFIWGVIQSDIKRTWRIPASLFGLSIISLGWDWKSR